jgi:hypothetical protein
MCLAIARVSSATAEAYPAQEYRLRLNRLLPRLAYSRGTCQLILNPSRSSRLLPFQACFRGALLALRFRLEKYAQHTFSTEEASVGCSENSATRASLLWANS